MFRMIINREMRRVPITFDWPLEKVWAGYTLTPYNYKEDKLWEDNDSEYINYIKDNIILVDPPIGEGFQCWETVSEGSPITPVFKTFDEVCRYLADNPSGITSELSFDDWVDVLNKSFRMIDVDTKRLVRNE